jgi:Putative amidoligase enzyme
MVSSIDIGNNISVELAQVDDALNTVTSGAELEFLPLTDFPVSRLAPEVIEKLKPIYELSKLSGDIITRQPHFNRLVQMLATMALINHHANIEHPGNSKYSAKLNREDCEKHKQAMLKTAYKYDEKELIIPVEENNQQFSNKFRKMWHKVRIFWNFLYLQNYDSSKFYQVSSQPKLVIEPQPNRIEQTVIAIFNRLEALGLIQLPGENTLNVGIDGSVHGTNRDNINYYENLYKSNQDNRFRFRIYSGQEIGFPVCSSIEETIDLYQFVVATLKKNGVHFTTTSGVHLHVGIKKGETTEEVINHLSNVTAVSVAVSQIMNGILPTTRRNNIYAMPFGDNVNQHIAHYKKHLSKLEYIQKKIDMVKQSVISDSDLLDDKDAAMYEFVLGIAYSIAPVQHEYNYHQIIGITAKTVQEFARKASIIVRNPRYTSVNITPLLQNARIPTYEWRILASCEDAELQGKFFTFFYRVIESQKKCLMTRLVTDYQSHLDYICFHFNDGKIMQMENTLHNWLLFTECDELFSDSDFAKLNDEAYWKCFDAKNQQYINPESNKNWADGQFYPAPNIDINQNLTIQELIQLDREKSEYLQQDLAILRLLNHAFDINI